MKKRSLIIPFLVLLNLLPLIFSKKVNSESAWERTQFHLNRAVDRRKAGDNFGAMSDYNMVIKINADEGAVGFAYFLRSFIKANNWGDKKGACEDLKIASSLNNFPAKNDAKKNFNKWCLNNK
mgnify:CR=1 FL=1